MIILGGSGSAKAYSQAGQLSAEAILSIRTVRALQAEDDIVDVYTKILDEPFKKEIAKLPKQAVFFGVAMGMMMGPYVIGFGYGPYLVADQGVTMEDMFKAMLCIMMAIFGVAIG